MKDHEIAQFVNQLTEVARTYGHTQQLRDRISEVVHRRLEHGPYARKTMQLAAGCVGKVCGCPRGSCAEAAACPEDTVTVFVPTSTPVVTQEDLQARQLGFSAMHACLRLRPVVPSKAGIDYKPHPRFMDDGTQFCATDKDA